MRKFGCGLLMVLGIIAAAFVALLLFGQTLPDAKPQPKAGAATPAPTPGKAATSHGGILAVPVTGVTRSAIADSWEDPREGGVRQHHGTDIMAPGGTVVTAAAPGTIEKLFQSAAGGTTLYVRSPDRQWVYYYAHLSGYAPGIHEGQGVKTGDPLGYVGDTGDAGPGNYHLHFAVTRTQPQDRWWQGEDVNPYPLLAGTRASR